MKTRTKAVQCSRPLETEALLHSWKTTSLSNSWRFEDDWAVPETQHLAEDHSRGLPIGEAARNLGYARAMQGIGITETIEDLAAFFTANGGHTDAGIQQRLTEGWVAANNTTEPDSCADPLTGLPTYEHFIRSLHDLYNAPGFTPAAMVIATLTLPPLSQGLSLRWDMLVEFGNRCQEAFDGATASLAFQGKTLTVLMQRSDENHARLMHCQAALLHSPLLPWDEAELAFLPLTPEPAGVLTTLIRNI